MRPYKQSNIPLAKELRKNMTPWEKKLWYQFLNRYPVRFQRQKAIDRFIVDFYCAKAALAIEVDGAIHDVPQQYDSDERRTAQLNQLGLQVLRFSNQDIDHRFEAVCQQIEQIVKERCSHEPI